MQGHNMLKIKEHYRREEKIWHFTEYLPLETEEDSTRRLTTEERMEEDEYERPDQQPICATHQYVLRDFVPTKPAPNFLEAKKKNRRPSFHQNILPTIDKKGLFLLLQSRFTLNFLCSL